MITWQEKTQEALALLRKVREIAVNPEATGEEKTEMTAMLKGVEELQADAAELKRIHTLGQELDTAVEHAKAPQPTDGKFVSRGQFLQSVFTAGSAQHNFHHDGRLEYFKDGGPSEMPRKTAALQGSSVKGGWAGGPSSGKASMAEGVGATGGFLVPAEFRAELLAGEYEQNIVRQRATIIPMSRRQINIPVLNQTGTTAGQPHQFGGMIATWTEEAEEKDQNDPTFRQIELVAHKLVCYTRASDELLEDSAIGLDAFLRSQMGFAGAIAWHEDWAFLRGTGAGQPLGVINAGATVIVPRAAVGVPIQIDDIVNMLEAFQGRNPVWHITRAAMSNLMLLNGPAANPSYVFMPNARDGAPATLMGYPIEWTEKLPAVGTAGDILLADWGFYLIGDRQRTTIASTNLERFRYDQTSWRAVHRVDGQPWLSAPWTLADGATQISPFVILGDKST